ncbi:MAG: hypothetical protein IH789_13570 [Acidobacteria bacterium]|nr:hypothetical protein [Acidobacteriota bacterium]
MEVFGDIAKLNLRVLSALGDESTDGGDMHKLFAEAAHVGMGLVVVLVLREVLGHVDQLLVDAVPGARQPFLRSRGRLVLSLSQPGSKGENC